MGKAREEEEGARPEGRGERNERVATSRSDYSKRKVEAASYLYISRCGFQECNYQPGCELLTNLPGTDGRCDAAKRRSGSPDVTSEGAQRGGPEGTAPPRPPHPPVLHPRRGSASAPGAAGASRCGAVRCGESRGVGRGAAGPPVATQPRAEV